MKNRLTGSLAVLLLTSGLVLISGLRSAVPAEEDFKLKMWEGSQDRAAIGAWRTWVLVSARDMRPSPPPDAQKTLSELGAVRALVRARDPVAVKGLHLWEKGAILKWNQTARELIAKYRENPPRASRVLALLAVAQYDTVVACWDAKYAYRRAGPPAYAEGLLLGKAPADPSYVAERTAVSAAAVAVLRYAFPEHRCRGVEELLDREMQDAVRSDLLSGACFPSDVQVGSSLGGRVAQAVIARAQTDGADSAQGPYTCCETPGRWAPTGDALQPLLPGWGSVKPWVLPKGHSLRPPPPPVFGSEEWNLAVNEVRVVSQTLTPSRRAIARKWAGGPGSETPPGQWNGIAAELAVAAGLSEASTARMFALLAVAQADAFVACWDAKYAYDSCRPSTAVRAETDPGWQPYLDTPPFPSYPSGHATTSGAASQVLGYLFPDRAMDIAGLAGEARDSRLYGGIHTRFDNDVGFDLGRMVGNRVLATLAEVRTP